MPRLLRLLVALLAGALLITPLTATTSAGAATRPTGSISGTVSVDGVDELEYLEAQLYQRVPSMLEPDTYTWRVVDYDWFGDDPGDRTYRFSGVAPGSYRVRITNGADDNPWAPTWFGDSPSAGGATTIVVGPGQKVTGKGVELLLGGTVSGRLDDADGQPLKGAYVSALRYVSSKDAFEPVAYAETGADGTYTVRGLPTGTYRISFTSSYGRLWYDGERAALHATTVPVTIGEDVPGIDAAYAPSLSVSGTVKDLAGPIAAEASEVEIYVAVFTYDEESGEWISHDDVSATTDEQGRYVIHGLAPGRHAFHVRSDRLYAYRWLHGRTPDVNDPSSYVDLTADTADLDVRLQREAERRTRPTIVGTPKAGRTLTAKNGTWRWDGAAVRADRLAYRWTAGGSSKVLGTAKTFRVPAALAGRRVRVTVRFVKSGYAGVSAPSYARKIAP